MRYRRFFYTVFFLFCLGSSANAATIPNNYEITDGLAVYFTPRGLDTLAGAIDPFIATLDLTEVFGNTIPGPLGTTIVLKTIDLTHGGAPQTQISPVAPAGMEASVHLPRASFDIDVDSVLGTISGNILVTLDFQADMATILNDLSMGFLATNLSVTTSNVDANFSGLAGAVLNFIINTFLPDLINGPVEETVFRIVNQLFSGTPVFDFLNLFDEVLRDSPFLVETAIDANVTAQNGIFYAIDGGLYPIDADPFGSPGFTQPNEYPNFSLYVPGTNVPYDFALAVSDDLLNLILDVLAKGDVLDATLDSARTGPFGIDFSTDELGAFIPELPTLHPGELMRAHIIIDDGPRLQFDGQSTGRLFFDRTTVEFEMLTGAVPVKAFSVEVDLNFNVSIYFNPNAQDISFNIELAKAPGGNPQVSAVFLDKGVLQTTTSTEIDQAMKDMLHQYQGILPFDEIIAPLVSLFREVKILGLDPTVEDVRLAGPDYGFFVSYMNFTGSLIYEPDVIPLPAKAVLATDPDNHRLVALNALTTEAVPRSPFDYNVDFMPGAMYFSPMKEKLYLALEGASSTDPDLAILDGRTFRKVPGSPLDIGGVDIVDIEFSPNRNILYLLDSRNDQIFAMNAASDLPVEINHVNTAGMGASAFVVDRDASHLYVLHRDSNDFSMFDMTPSVPNFLGTFDLSPILTRPIAGALNKRDELLYIIGESSKSLIAVDISQAPTGFTIENETQVNGQPSDVIFCATENLVFVSNFTSGEVACFDALSLDEDLLSPVMAGSGPSKMTLTPGGLLLVANRLNGALNIISVRTLTNIYGSPYLNVGALADFAYYTSEPLDIVPPLINGVVQLNDTTDTAEPYVVDVSEVRDNVELDAVHLLYGTDYQGTVNTTKVEMLRYAGDAFKGEIPGQVEGTQITYSVRATDLSGNTALSGPFHFAITNYDTEAPTSYITVPVEDELIQGSRYTIEGIADDNASGVAQVEVTTDGGQSWHPASGTDTWTYDWGISTDGTFRLASRATDNAGNVETVTNFIKVKVDNTAPSILLGGYWSTNLTASAGGTMTVAALCTDSDVERLELTVGGVATGVFLYDDGGINDISGADDGLYGFKVTIGPTSAVSFLRIDMVATDTVGNKSMTWPLMEVR